MTLIIFQDGHKIDSFAVDGFDQVERVKKDILRSLVKTNNISFVVDHVPSKNNYRFITTKGRWLTCPKQEFQELMRPVRYVAQIKNGKILKVFKGSREAFKKTGIHQGCINMVLNGEKSRTAAINGNT